MKDELSERVMEEFMALKPKMYSYLLNTGCVDKKAEDAKCEVKGEIKFEHYKTCVQDNKTVLKTQQKFRSEAYNVFVEKVNKFALSKTDGKITQLSDGVVSYSYGTGARRVQIAIHKNTSKKKMINSDDVTGESRQEQNPH